jgi:hypothetical protein
LAIQKTQKRFADVFCARIGEVVAVTEKHAFAGMG